MTPEAQQSEIVIDRSLLGEIVLRRRWQWLRVGLIIFALLLIYQLFVASQTFTSTVSISVQQSAGAQSPLSALTSQANNKKYMGILKSRRLARVVENKVKLQQLYGLSEPDKAYNLLMDNALRIRDTAADGLVYIDVALPGPARFSRANEFRDRVKQAAALAANTYASALQDYYKNTDNDRDTVMLRDATKYVRQARADYDTKVAQLTQFVGGLKGDSRSLPSTEVGTMPQSSTSELSTLYSTLARLESDIRGAEASRETQDQRVAQQLNNLGSLPAEDSLLTTARNDVRRAETNLRDLQLTFSNASPRVRLAQERLRLAQARLAKEEESVRQKRTTENIVSDSELEAMRVRRDTLVSQISDAESRLLKGRELTPELSRLRNDIQIQLEGLRTAVGEATKLRLNSVSAQSRITVLDEAIPAKNGQPGLITSLLTSLFVVIAILAAWLVVEYILQMRRPSSSTGRPASPNGRGGAEGRESALAGSWEKTV